MLFSSTACCLVRPVQLAINCFVSLPLARSLGQTSGWGVPGGQVPAFLDEATLHQASLYVHWPFCERRCTYCNFNKYVSPSVDHDAMRDGLVRETETLLSVSQVKEITSIFFGGGTPSLAQPSTIASVLETVARVARVPHNVEVSIEANPTSASASRLAEFKEAGVTRLSLGVQALCNRDLRILGRDHTTQEALWSLEEARKLFPGDTSVDIIFGRPGQSVESWEEELEELVALCDHHVSLYQLTLERGTALYRQVQEKVLSMPEQEEMAEMYQVARRILEKAGFLQYEVSNFAKNVRGGRELCVSITWVIGEEGSILAWAQVPMAGLSPGVRERPCERQGYKPWNLMTGSGKCDGLVMEPGSECSRPSWTYWRKC
ncbi:radical S-adenosyl methionine domain-containing protein 1, mitochondrial isoform X3 [Stegostoma tigrinum]|uniref:radical S-adenosyl methionine domain-containing protein 1, mitochondrial isoform X3 n=1 Tax=Stegostoma tigrinum TaxID=3053191 RepID=UPI00202B0C42|nr:radical S-adenosyl methionine domain-containing protein 1, mitochondrial isoform X3 [Stegostoma tigrinum]XP_048411298.1 radical S-adenosyl methionine domain-containing protein 1, mitochondrial isoform X3 [Stegostoma tigrinum]